MSTSRRSRVSRVLAVTVVVWLLLGAVAGVPTAAASDATALDDDGLLNDTVSGTTETTNGTVGATTETVAETTESAGETLDTATGGVTDETTDGVTTAVDETTEAVDATGTTAGGTTGATTDAVSAAADGDLDGATERTTSIVEATATRTVALSEHTAGTIAALSGTVDATSSTVATVVESGATPELASGTSDDTTTRERAARIDGATGDTAVDADGTDDGATDGTADGAADLGDGTDDRAAAAAGSGGLLTTLSGTDSVPISEDDAMGGLLGGLLLGAVGVAVRQGSMAGGTGTGTTMLRTAAASAAVGDGTFSRLVRMLAPFRYSRYDDSDPLELDARRDVYEAISDRPGEPITAISDRADVNLSTARHHVKVLRDEGLVATARVRNCERFYPAGTDDLELAAAMADECTADLLDALVRLEPASVSGLADDVDRSPSTVTHHLQKLEEDDLVVRERNGRSVENKLSEPARVALDPETERRQHAAERRLDTEAEAEATSGAHAD